MANKHVLLLRMAGGSTTRVIMGSLLKAKTFDSREEALTYGRGLGLKESGLFSMMGVAKVTDEELAVLVGKVDEAVVGTGILREPVLLADLSDKIESIDANLPNAPFIAALKELYERVKSGKEPSQPVETPVDSEEIDIEHMKKRLNIAVNKLDDLVERVMEYQMAQEDEEDGTLASAIESITDGILHAVKSGRKIKLSIEIE